MRGYGNGNVTIQDGNEGLGGGGTTNRIERATEPKANNLYSFINRNHSLLIQLKGCKLLCIKNFETKQKGRSFLKIISRQVKKSIAFSIFRKYQLHNEYLPQKKQELKMKLAGNESVNILFLQSSSCRVQLFQAFFQKFRSVG